MKRYFTNLWMAIIGANPFRKELEEAKERLDKAADNMSAMQDQLYAALEKWEQSTKMANGYETLIENLRERIAEKDSDLEKAGKEFHDRMERMKEDYQKRIDEYNRKIDELQGK